MDDGMYLWVEGNDAWSYIREDNEWVVSIRKRDGLEQIPDRFFGDGERFELVVPKEMT